MCVVAKALAHQVTSLPNSVKALFLEKKCTRHLTIISRLLSGGDFFLLVPWVKKTMRITYYSKNVWSFGILQLKSITGLCELNGPLKSNDVKR